MGGTRLKAGRQAGRPSLLHCISIDIHWGKFAESEHAWNESVNLYVKAADSLKVPVTVPRIGEPYTIGTVVDRVDWWNQF